MKYYTIRMFSEGSILETLTTKVAVNRMPDKSVKLLMKSCGATEAQLFESTYWGHYETGRTNGRPIRNVKI